MVRYYLVLLLLVYRSLSFSQNITAAEYFLDTDPGVGNGVPITGPYTGNPISKNFNLSAASIQPGVHRLVVRTKNSNNVWSHQLSQLFAVIGASSGNPLVASGRIQGAEYFFDNDPGVGNGIAITGISTANIVNKVNYSIPLSSLAPGVHRLVVRSKDENGKWGHQLSQLFAIVGSTSGNPLVSSGRIQSAEYYIDTDPGVGNGVAVSTGGLSNTVNKTFELNLNGVNPGVHRLVLRTKDENGIWSHQLAQLFAVVGATSGNPLVSSGRIQAAEYFIDADPGVGNGTVVSTGGLFNTVNKTFALDLSGVNPGVHRLVLRTKDENGVWSHQLAQLFAIVGATSGNPLVSSGSVTAAEYFFNTDPGVGNGTPISVTAGDLVNLTSFIEIPQLAQPTNILGIRVKDGNNNWGLTLTDTFSICIPNWVVNFSPSNSCQGTATQFTDLCSNVDAGSIYDWDFNNDNIYDASGPGNKSYVYPAAGAYTAKLRVRNGLCIKYSTQEVYVNGALSGTTVINNPTDCGSLGTIQINNPSGFATCSFLNTNFATVPSSMRLNSGAIVEENQLILATTSSITGGGTAAIDNNNYNANAFQVEFDFQIWGGSGADGMSFSYAGDIPNPLTEGGTEGGVGSGIKVGFDSFDNGGNPNGIYISYNTTQLAYLPFQVRSPDFRNCRIKLNDTGLLSLWIDNVLLINNIPLPQEYLSADKTGWDFAFSARIGGLNDNHIIKDLSIELNNLYEFSVNNGSTWQSLPIFEDLNSGSYQVKIRPVCDITCSASLQNVTLNLVPAPETLTITANGPITFCSGGSVTLTSDATIGNRWSNGELTQSIVVTQSGVYRDTIILGNCTIISNPITVNVIDVPVVPTISTNGPLALCSGGSVILTSSSNSDNVWSNGATSQSITVNTAGNYSVTVGANGCTSTSDSAAVTLDVNSPSFTYYLDADSDGFGVTSNTLIACSLPSGYSDVNGDCNDNNPEIHPGVDEYYNFIDDDCDGLTDENDGNLLAVSDGSWTNAVFPSPGACGSPNQFEINGFTAYSVWGNNLPNTTITKSFNYSPQAGYQVLMEGAVDDLATIKVNGQLVHTSAAVFDFPTLNLTPFLLNGNNLVQVDLTDGGGCYIFYAVIYEAQVSDPTFNPIGPICQGSEPPILPLTSTNGITGSWSPSSVDNTTTRDYTFTPDNGQGASSVTITVNVNPVVTPSFTQVGSICLGTSLSALPTTSNNNISGVWTPELNTELSQTYTFTPNVGQCATSASMPITVNPNVIAEFTPIPPVCSGETLSALPTTSINGIVGTWAPSLNNTETTTYTFVPNAGQCANTATLTVIVNPGIAPIFTGVAPICAGDTLAALPTISNNNITGTWEPTLNNATTTTYTFTPTTGQCATTAEQTISVNLLPTITISAPATCSTDLTTWSLGISLSAGILTSTSGNVVNTSGNNWSVSQIPAGTNITLTASATCSNSLEVTSPNCNCPVVTAPVSGGNQIYCSTAAIPGISASVAEGNTIDWYDAAISGTLLLSGSTNFNPTAEGTYYAQARNISTSCLSSTRTAITVTSNAQVAPFFAPINPVCAGATLSALPATSTNGITGTWSPALNNAATTDYTFTPSTAQCATNASLTITVNPTITPLFEAIGPISPGSTPPVLPNVSLNGISGTWNPSMVSNLNTATYTFTPSGTPCATNTTLTIEVIDQLPCSFKLRGQISNATCYGFTNGSVLVNVEDTTNNCGGSWNLTLTGIVEGSWNSASGDIADFNNLSAGNYKIKGINACGCEDSLLFLINQNAPTLVPVISVEGSDSVCAGNTITLNSDLIENITWSNGLNSQSISANSSGSYYVSYVDSFGCSSVSETKSVYIDSYSPLSSEGANTICQGDIITLNASEEALDYLWSTGATTNSITVSPLSTQEFRVNLTSAFGCEYSDSITIFVNPLLIPGAVTTMLPAQATAELSNPINLSWVPGQYNTQFDLFLWRANTIQPQIPTVSNISNINIVTDTLQYGLTYKWMVTSKNGQCFSTPGEIQTFTLRNLPDLVVTEVLAPITAFSGQNISVTWRVKNIGSGNTMLQQWGDLVYFSEDTLLNSFDQLIGSSTNVSALQINESYQNTISLTLPNSISGNYYLIVKTNTNILESNTGNNTRFNIIPIQVILLPPPDLQVTNIINSNNGFSGTNIQLTYTVKNFGASATQNQTWFDRVYITQEPFLDLSTTPIIFNSKIVGNVMPDSSYTQTLNLKVPKYIFGTFYLYVIADATNAVFEVPFENNNTNSNTVQIFLTPPPDLNILDVTIPSSASNSQTIQLNWSVKNEGANATELGQYWYDKIYLSTNPNLNDVNPADLIGISNIRFALPEISIPGPSCSFDEEYFSSNYFALQQNEYNSPGTNTHYLQPLSINNDNNNNAANGGDLNCVPPLFEVSKPFNNGDVYNVSATGIIPQNIPSGSYYIYVKADANEEVFEYLFEDNNLRRAPSPLLITNPDLIVPTVNLPVSGNSGQPVSISWQVKNNGNGGTYNTSRKDLIYLNSGSAFNISTALLLDSLQITETIISGQTVTKQKQVVIPNGISGNYRFFIFADGRNSVFENVNENNNVNTSSPVINIQLSPWTDLKPISISLPDTVYTESDFTFNYIVKNNGAANLNGQWNDVLYISNSPTWDFQASKYLGVINKNTILNSTAIYSQDFNLQLPLTQFWNCGVNEFQYNPLYSNCNVSDSTTFYIYLITDQQNLIYEHTDESNNIFRSGGFILIDPQVDHIVQNVVIQDTVYSGTNVGLNWSVKNLAAKTESQSYSSWIDAFLLSVDSIPSGDDILYGYNLISSPLENNATYSLNQNFTVPNGLSGDYYVIGISNFISFENAFIQNSNLTPFSASNYYFISSEEHLQNNFNLKRGENGQAKQMHIIFSPPPDLKVISLLAPAVAQSGQPVTIKYKVRNEGTGETLTNLWNDGFYLSTTNNLAGVFYNISLKQHLGVLQPNEFYEDSVEVTFPIQFNGNYYLIAKADAYNPFGVDYNQVYEHLNESNNDRFSVINIFQPPPSDLIAINVIGPDTADAGLPVSLSWVVKNISLNPAYGIMRDGVYFSYDNVWDINDPLITTLTEDIYIPPLGQKSQSVSADLNGVTLGYHYVIIRTDLLNNIYETNDLNNSRNSDNQVYVTVKELPLNILVSDSLVTNKPLYYRVAIPDSLDDETLLVTLKGDSTNNISNQLFIKFEQIPTSSVYDAGFSNPFSANQEVIIPSVDSGSYYITSKWEGVSSNAQTISLKAEILPFAIRSVNTDHGGNTGSVTVEIKGSKFEPNMQIYLHSDSLNIDIPATGSIFVNSIKLFASFNLNQQPLGKYDVVLRKVNLDSTSLIKGFTIEPGNNGGFYIGGITNNGQSGSSTSPGCDPGAEEGFEGGLQLGVNSPSAVIFGNSFSMTLLYGNSGNTDIPVPSKILISENGLPISLTASGVQDNTTDLLVEFIELNGPPGILRPGATGGILIYTRAATVGNKVFSVK